MMLVGGAGEVNYVNKLGLQCAYVCETGEVGWVAEVVVRLVRSLALVGLAGLVSLVRLIGSRGSISYCLNAEIGVKNHQLN